jgi:hypothetical protein
MFVTYQIDSKIKYADLNSQWPNFAFKCTIRNAQENLENLVMAVREDDKLCPERKMPGK